MFYHIKCYCNSASKVIGITKIQHQPKYLHQNFLHQNHITNMTIYFLPQHANTVYSKSKDYSENLFRHLGSFSYPFCLLVSSVEHGLHSFVWGMFCHEVIYMFTGNYGMNGQFLLTENWHIPRKSESIFNVLLTLLSAHQFCFLFFAATGCWIGI